jgi:hypothetical protein
MLEKEESNIRGVSKVSYDSWDILHTLCNLSSKAFEGHCSRTSPYRVILKGID